MTMTPRQAFKFGFLLRCADENLSDEQVAERIKYAAERLGWDGESPLLPAELVEACLATWEKQASPLEGVGAIGNLVKNLGLWGLAGGAGLGAGAGYLTARMTDKEVDPDEVKKQELIAAYKQQAERIRRQMAARSYRQPKTPRVPRLVA